MRRLIAQFVACLTAVCLAAPAVAQDDDESRPGLISFITEGPHRERMVAADVFVPTRKAEPKPFQQQWQGLLLLKSEGKYRFHAFLQGTTKVQLGERTLLEGTSDEPAWI